MKPALVAFNRGRISKLALARTDFKRTALSAEVQTNWRPRTLGSMMLRPGYGYVGATLVNAAAINIPFIFSRDDVARIELTNSAMRVWVNDALVTRPAVTAAVFNGNFDTDVSGWTDLDGAGSTSVWATGGFMSLTGAVNTFAKRRQQVTVNEVNTRHALDIVIERGPVLIRVGSTAGGDEYISETTLRTGSHSLAFTPTGNFYIDLFSYNDYASLVTSINVASAGAMYLATTWAESDLYNLRWDQSGDIVYVACDGQRQKQIERRDVDSWSVVTYQSDDGPFRVQNVSGLTITPSAISGDITLTASASLFSSGHVGALFRLTQTGQSETATITGANQFSDPIRVTGVDAARQFAVILSGTWAATVTLQYSVGAPGSWVDATSGSWTSNIGISYDDTLDNQIIYYRVGVKTGNYTSGTVTTTLSYSAGSQTGIARVTGYTSSTVVNAAVLSSFATTAATSDWAESYWSGVRGFPTSNALYEGRLWWAGKDRIWGSVSDSFYSHDDTTEGDSGPISRSIGSGPVDKIHWLVPVSRLLLGAEGSIWSARSSSFDEPLTPTNFNLKDVSTQGATNVAAVKIDNSAVFVQRSGTRVYEGAYDGNTYDYGVTELTGHVPEAGEPGIIRIAVQRQPETRIHMVRSDGTVAILTVDKQEEVNCLTDDETDGFIEDVCILPGTIEDQVYYVVRRTINGATVRYHEKHALESECQGGTLNKQMDSFITGTGSVTGLSHLEGQTVEVWGDGVYKGSGVVSGGAVAGITATSWVAGLTYEARYKSTKLAYGVDETRGTALCEKKKISQLGVIALNMHPSALKYGPDFTFMDNMPLVESGATVDGDAVWAHYDEETFEFPGEWDTDARLCLKATAPFPVTLLAAVIEIETNSK